MVEGIIGKKLGMTRIFGDKGREQAVTAIAAGPCTVTQVKTNENDGYKAAQLGFGVVKDLKSPEKGHLKGLELFRYLREVDLGEKEATVGQKVDVSLFKAGDRVDVTGTTKGKGFAGVVKRYHFKGGKATRGQSDRARHAGAIGATTSPGRVFKGLRMAGHMGNQRLTVRGLEVVEADASRNLLVVKGAVPGATNGLLIITKSGGRK